jgi:hypothetical protein
MENKLKVIDEIKNGLIELATELNGESDLFWTKSIKDLFYKITNKLNLPYGTMPTNEEIGENRQWVFDLIWYELDKNSLEEKYKPLLSLPLILECEWKPFYEDLVWDFDKLIIAKADMKVFIFQINGNSQFDGKTTVNNLKQRMYSFQEKNLNETYFFIYWYENKFNFDFI